jgi:hypothetical protein
MASPQSYLVLHALPRRKQERFLDDVRREAAHSDPAARFEAVTPSLLLAREEPAVLLFKHGGPDPSPAMLAGAALVDDPATVRALASRGAMYRLVAQAVAGCAGFFVPPFVEVTPRESQRRARCTRRSSQVEPSRSSV